jgi:hypothetical protein
VNRRREARHAPGEDEPERSGTRRAFVRDHVEKLSLRVRAGLPVACAKFPMPIGRISNASPAPRTSAFRIRAGRAA